MAQNTDTTNASTVKPEVGKRYRTREGRIAEITGFDDTLGELYPVLGGVDGCGGFGWTAEGEWVSNTLSTADLIEEIPDEPEQPAIDLTNNKIPFGLLSFAEQEHLRSWPHGVEFWRDGTDDWRKQSIPSRRFVKLFVYRTIPTPKRAEWFVTVDSDNYQIVTSNRTEAENWQESYGGIAYHITTDADGSNPTIEVVE